MFLRALALLSIVLSALTGCSSGEKTYPVSGTVTYKKAPVAGADVTLTPVSEDAKTRPARGTTDASGKFSVKTYFAPGDDRPGALAGKYKITLQKIPPASGIVDPYKPGGMPKNELPAKYATAPTTPLEKEVVTTGANDFALDLTD
jgi:hypothetical protein